MNLRKKFNIRNEAQSRMLWKNWGLFLDKALKCADEENKQAREIADKANNTCPACQSNKVVEKIVGYKDWGYPHGPTLQTCRHCSICQNDWLETKPKSVYASQIRGRWYKQLVDKINTKTNNKEFLADNPFNGVYAETLNTMYNSLWFDGEEPKRIKLRKLRNIFKSVFD